MELVLHAFAGCAGVDLALILTKMKQPVAGLEITVSGDRADEHPRVYVKVASTCGSGATWIRARSSGR